MVESKAWKWEIVTGEKEEKWKNPSVESFYLLNRWKSQGKDVFLDLGCGLGRHTILFAKNDFNVLAFDLSEDALKRTKSWAEELHLNNIKYDNGDMLNLPYENNSVDCILCRNVISHTDTEGMKKIINEINRVLKDGGECYLTLGSKESWGFKQDWPVVDENTKIRIEDGPENGIPHFYADYELIKNLLKNNKIESITQIQNFYETDGKSYNSYHFHLLIKK